MTQVTAVDPYWLGEAYPSPISPCCPPNTLHSRVGVGVLLSQGEEL